MRRSVLITGCSAGSAGYALAKEYSSRGMHVFATSRKLETMGDLGSVPNITLLQLDVTKIDSIRAARDKVQELFSSGSDLDTGQTLSMGLDLLINNAGIALTKPALDHPIDDIREMFETNVFGLMSMVQEFLPLLMKGEDPCVVNVGSVAALVPYAFGSSYNASKAAVHAYSDTLRVELKPLGIKVVTVVLGGVQSNIFSHPRKPLPDNSYYKPIEEEFTNRRIGARDKSMTLDVFGREFVNATLKTNPPRHFFAGSGAMFVALIAALVPTRLMDWFVGKILYLNRLAEIRKETVKTK